MNTAQKDMTAEDFMKQATIRAEEGDYVGAIHTYTQVIQLDPNYARAYGNRGLVRATLGDKRGAMQDWQTAAKLFLAQGSTGNYEMVLSYLKKVEKR